jgi:hypothetical protein
MLLLGAPPLCHWFWCVLSLALFVSLFVSFLSFGCAVPTETYPVIVLLRVRDQKTNKQKPQETRKAKIDFKTELRAMIGLVRDEKGESKLRKHAFRWRMGL